MNKQFWMGSAAMAAALIVGSSLAAPAWAADVGVSISVSQPGVYGRVDIGQFPQPQVIVQQPVIIQQPRAMYAQPAPVYMWVPPGHQKKWSRYCGRYNACGVPVYFVQDGWYHEHVDRDRRGDRRDHDRRGDRDDRDDHRGRDKDRGHGHGRGHD